MGWNEIRLFVSPSLSGMCNHGTVKLPPTAIFLVDSPYIHSCFNLSTMAGFFLSPRGALYRGSTVLLKLVALQSSQFCIQKIWGCFGKEFGSQSVMIFENHDLHSGTYLYSPCKTVPLPPPRPHHTLVITLKLGAFRVRLHNLCRIRKPVWRRVVRVRRTKGKTTTKWS